MVTIHIEPNTLVKLTRQTNVVEDNRTLLGWFMGCGGLRFQSTAKKTIPVDKKICIDIQTGGEMQAFIQIQCVLVSFNPDGS